MTGRRPLRRHAALAALGVALLVAACERSPRHPPTPPPARPAPLSAGAPRSVVVVIGDGLGPSQLTLARDFVFGPGGGRFAFESMPVVGLVTTHSGSNAVTDSAAAATALLAGVKTDNRYVALDLDGRPVRTLADAARDAGWRVGVVTSTTVAHATPAVLYAHHEDRYDYPEIAAQLVAAPPDLMIGGGRQDFVPTSAGGEREDGRDLLAEARAAGLTVWDDGRALAATPPRLPLLVLAAHDHLAFSLDDAARPAAERAPTLAALARFALATLEATGDPWFLLLEGGRIDHAAHDFDAAGVGHETAAFDTAVAVVLAHLERHPETLVVLTADHATAGLAINDFVDWPGLHRQRASVSEMTLRLRDGSGDAAYLEAMTGYDWSDEDVAAVRAVERETSARRELGRRLSERNGVTWVPRIGGSGSTYGHTGEDVPLFVAGRGAERFRGVLDNTDVARGIAALLGWRVGAADEAAAAASPLPD